MKCPGCGEVMFLAGTEWADEFVWVCLDDCRVGGEHDGI